MRRRISLYIAGRRADLSDDGLVLMNYAVADLTNPAILKNSWSQDVDLPRTPDNAKIFGHSGRLDRLAGPGGAGPDFNASRKAPFVIYAETSEVLVSGYLKLTAVTDDAFRVSLFGGLGEFLWGLSYDSEGNRKSLASLDYGEDLDFTITKETVLEAWARLGGDTTKPTKWDVINFAPAYNGIPTDFDASHALADHTDLMINNSIDGYTDRNDMVLINLPDGVDEWAAKDLRSYLQRPVISMEKILQACADPDNNGGWTVDLSALTITYQQSWLTRPLLPSLGTYKQIAGGMRVSFVQYAAGKVIARFTVEDAPSGSEITASVRCNLGYAVATAVTPLQTWKRWSGQGYTQEVLFCQAVGYAGDGTLVAAGPVRSYYKSYDVASPSAIASAAGYTPRLSAAFTAPEGEHGYALSGGLHVRQRDIALEITGTNIERIDVEVTVVTAIILDNGGVFGASQTGSAMGSLWDSAGNEYTPTQSRSTAGSGSAAGETSEKLRSGARVTKEMLLSTAATPADYLVSFCKAFGCYILADSASRTVQILPREDFFRDAVTDLTKRVDRSRGIEVEPIAFDAKWYELKHESVGGRFEEEYRRTSGVQYGIQRLDAGYDFDADVKDILAGSALKSCAAVQDHSRFWYAFVGFGGYRPSPLLMPGCSYTLWNADNATLETPLPTPDDTFSRLPYNNAHPGYDVTHRAEFRDAENEPVDGADVLLFFRGLTNLKHFNVTDDLPLMDSAVGAPCWIFAINNDGVDVPGFSRYHTIRDMDTGRTEVLTSLDFGIPREVDIPSLEYTRGTVYLARWRSYIVDRLSVHGKVLRCRVDLAGLQVGPELLRGFFWYEGSLWALSKISNYSLTTYDPTECEFIQVRDIDNYTT